MVLSCCLELNHDKCAIGRRRVAATCTSLRRTALSQAEVAVLTLGHETCNLLCVELACCGSGHFTSHNSPSVPL